MKDHVQKVIDGFSYGIGIWGAYGLRELVTTLGIFIHG